MTNSFLDFFLPTQTNPTTLKNNSFKKIDMWDLHYAVQNERRRAGRRCALFAISVCHTIRSANGSISECRPPRNMPLIKSSVKSDTVFGSPRVPDEMYFLKGHKFVRREREHIARDGCPGHGDAGSSFEKNKRKNRRNVMI